MQEACTSFLPIDFPLFYSLLSQGSGFLAAHVKDTFGGWCLMHVNPSDVNTHVSALPSTATVPIMDDLFLDVVCYSQSACTCTLFPPLFCEQHTINAAVLYALCGLS